MKHNIFCCLTLAILLTACDDEMRAKVEPVYKTMCPESAQFSLQNLPANPTCNGIPLAFVLGQLESHVRLTQDDAKTLVDDLLQETKLNLRATDANGETPVMLAIDQDAAFLSQAMAPYSDASQQDINGSNFLHHLALHAMPSGLAASSPGSKTDWMRTRDYTPFLQNIAANSMGVAGSTILNRANKAGQTPIMMAYQNKNYALVWSFIQFGADISFLTRNLQDIDPCFFFQPQIDKAVAALPAFFSALNVRKSPAQCNQYGSDIANYGLAAFAAENGLVNLAQFLVQNRFNLAQPTSQGTPLVIAFNGMSNAVLQPNSNSSVKIAEILMQAPDARASFGAMSAALHAGDPRFVKQLLSDRGAGFFGYENPLLMSANPTNQAWPAVDLAAVSTFGTDINQNSNYANILIRYFGEAVSIYTGLSKPAAQMYFQNLWGHEAPDFNHQNLVGQTVTDFYFYLTPESQEGELCKRFLSIFPCNAFDQFLSVAKRQGALAALDEFGMKPIDYWLLNPERKLGNNMRSHKDQFNQLLASSGDLSVLNINEDSILSLAVLTGQLDYVEALYNQDSHLMGRLVQIANLQGHSPLDLAIAGGHADIIQFLRGH